MKDMWDANLYDGKHSFVSMLGNDLLDMLAPKQGEQILDIGCGTGDLANELQEQQVKVIGIDKSENMVQQAKNKYPQITFLVKDAVDLKYTSEFDAIFSNATLHWVKTPKQALNCIYKSLKTGGRFVAEFGGKGNVQQITNEIFNQYRELGLEIEVSRFPWYFPSIAEYTTIMEEVGFRVTFAQHFDRPTALDANSGLRNWIEMFASSLFEGQSENVKEKMIVGVEKNLKETLYQEEHWIADYKRIRVVGFKEDI
ncbi:class I SAM-dependent methyltransferase [Salipaludibacillus sp. HK11]|uniref:class I SAM-dependent methyltransferase n=1 Tax=Salipaludibacillus sp. HK11 TaxID=3394320 RepID=UPI0039FCF483